MIFKENNSAGLYGLALAGGKSTRMGFDKGLADWHGKPQRYYLADMLKSFCSEVFISCRAEQQPEIDNAYHTIPDTYSVGGPLAGILTAFEKYPDHAWLVVACDLPLLDKATIQYLIENRDTNTAATTYKSPFDGLPEPLITIWEPASYNTLLSFQQEGYKCPRKVLMNSIITILDPPNPDALMNANTPEDAERVKAILTYYK